jgi:hypothetical protein
VQDFRERLTPRIPANETIADVDRLLQQGRMMRALRMARRIGVSEEDMRTRTIAAATYMYQHKQVGEVLSAIATHGVDVGYSVETLLRRLYDYRDYHTFLKQAHRLSVRGELLPEIESAINHLRERGRADEAAAWARKFGML